MLALNKKNTAVFLFCQNVFAAGGIHCKGADIQVSWGTSHITGSPMYGNPLTIETQGIKKVIAGKQVVGYYAHADVVLLLALDENMDRALVDLRFNSKTLKPSSVVYNEQRFSLTECLFE